MIGWHYNLEVGHMVRDRIGIFDKRNVGDADFYREVRTGRLNRDEFIALQMCQAETERLRTRFLSDGFLDDKERGILQERRRELDRLYNTYVRGDYHPRYQLGGYEMEYEVVGKGVKRTLEILGSGINQKMIDQYGRIYDGIKSGELSKREYNILDNNLEAISRYRGYAFGHGWVSDPLYHPYIHSALDYNNNLLNHYNNNFERRRSGFFIFL
jgi:hypothetical protein